jgi:MFS family permease
MAALYALTLCIGLFAVGIMPVGYASIKDLFPRSMAGTATGIANLFPFLVGALLQPALGLVLETVGKNGGVYTASAYQYAFCILLACSLVAFVCSLFVTETSSHRI